MCIYTSRLFTLGRKPRKTDGGSGAEVLYSVWSGVTYFRVHTVVEDLSDEYKQYPS